MTEESEDPEFVLRVRRKFPRANTPIIVACSNGRDYSQVRVAECGAGYTPTVGCRQDPRWATEPMQLEMHSSPPLSQLTLTVRFG